MMAAQILQRHIDEEQTSKQFPWETLRHLVGQVVYGGHVMDIWDRRMISTYLDMLLSSDLLEQKPLTPGFKCPDTLTYTTSKYTGWIEANLSSETTSLYGLHPNSEIRYLLNTSNQIFDNLMSFFPLSTPLIPATSPEQTSARVMNIAEHLLTRLPQEFEMENLEAIAAPLLLTETAPYVVVALQETSRMNALLKQMHSSLSDLIKAIQGNLTMTAIIEAFFDALANNQVPGGHTDLSWDQLAWRSCQSLGVWYNDLLARIQHLSSWTNEFQLPYCVWISGLFNPSAFLSAVKQTVARKHNFALEALTIETHMTTMHHAENAETYADMGTFIHGLYMVGARWERVTTNVKYEVDGILCSGHLADPLPRELYANTPILYARAVAIENEWQASSVGYFRENQKEIYECPVYMTTKREASYVFLATLHTIDPKSKWILGGVALVMQNDT
jgi:dynein heavy chain